LSFKHLDDARLHAAVCPPLESLGQVTCLRKRGQKDEKNFVAGWFSENGNCLNIHCLKHGRQKIQWSKENTNSMCHGFINALP